MGFILERCENFYIAKTAMKRAAAMKLLRPRPVWDAELDMIGGVGVPVTLDAGTTTEETVVCAAGIV